MAGFRATGRQRVNTALITAYDQDDQLIQKNRTIDDQDAIWSRIVAWLEDNQIAKIKVERFDPQDVCQQCYEVMPVAM